MGEIIVSIDISTSNVRTLIAQVNNTNHIEVLGIGVEACSGIKKGIIVDIEATSHSIRSSVEKAEAMANLEVGSAYVNIKGMNVDVINKRGSISIRGEKHVISAGDVEQVIYSVKDVHIPADRQIIDIIPRQFIVDGYDEIVDPTGMTGVKLEVDAAVISGKRTSVQNIVRSMEKAGLKVDGIILEAMADGELLLAPEDKDMGVLLLHIGAGVTDISVFKNKKLIFYDSIPVGGDHITNDISIGLKLPYAEAEKVKRQYALALTSLIKNDQEISATVVGEEKRPIMVSEVVEIIEARIEELFHLGREMMSEANVDFSQLSGIVLAGAGISNIDGAMQLAYEVFNIPSRVAVLRLVPGLKAEFATAMGIVKFVSSMGKSNEVGSEVKEAKPKKGSRKPGIFSRIFKLFSGFK